MLFTSHFGTRYNAGEDYSLFALWHVHTFGTQYNAGEHYSNPTQYNAGEHYSLLIK
jgi:hypothetical protein